MSQQAVDAQNAAFWDTLCGWNLAREAGITGRGEDDLRRFDELYLGFYPYLERYVPEDFGGKKVLEVGLGYGTLGQLIASRNADYYGVDIAEGPVANMRRRLSWLGLPEDHALQASVLELPFEDGTFDHVYSIGCLHHTGDLERSVDEVHRVLVPGGRLLLNVPRPTPFFDVLDDVMARHVGPEAAAFVRLVFSLNDPAELERLLRDAGFRDVAHVRDLAGIERVAVGRR
jgi:SAM-dependent methyltransferase